ncbi:MAG: hypothetical protein K2Q28_02590 [Hyphomicrobium sp.]|nr:hypothetical protein [Hyphomicrobium sp.]
MLRFANSRTLAALTSVLALAGCGKSGTPKGKVEVKQYIVVSAVDCADNTGLPFETCIDLLQTAIGAHDKAATTYPKIETCEKAEGADRCERIGEKSYRARLTAFQLTMSDKPTAVPLYAGKAATAGFRTSSNVEISADADTFIFTKSAADAAHLHISKKKS